MVKTKKIQNMAVKYVLFIAVVVCLSLIQNYFVGSANGQDSGTLISANSAGQKSNPMSQEVLNLRKDVSRSPIEPDTEANEANVNNKVSSWGNGSKVIGGNSLTAAGSDSIILQPSEGQIDAGTEASLRRLDQVAEDIYKKHNPEGNLYDGNGKETE
ncbi:MAG: hypothetical protein M0R48_03845 [Candidatus Omnitrophica bacterium]|jgi:hypothetical protein|nr:hypothetical protein [Candidatus Omnitrophota bacterium]